MIHTIHLLASRLNGAYFQIKKILLYLKDILQRTPAQALFETITAARAQRGIGERPRRGQRACTTESV
jgi:hypothetical protein